MSSWMNCNFLDQKQRPYWIIFFGIMVVTCGALVLVTVDKHYTVKSGTSATADEDRYKSLKIALIVAFVGMLVPALWWLKDDLGYKMVKDGATATAKVEAKTQPPR